MINHHKGARDTRAFWDHTQILLCHPYASPHKWNDVARFNSAPIAVGVLSLPAAYSIGLRKV